MSIKKDRPADKPAEKPVVSKRTAEEAEEGTAEPAGRTETAARARLRGLPKGGPSKPELKRYRTLLLQMRDKLVRSSRNLADEALKASGQDFSVDHMADHGTDNFEQDFSLALLEGETELMRDIEDAVEKIDGKAELPFGLCESCADDIGARGPEAVPNPWIPKGRLDVLPYARLCVVHQERQEGDGATG
jgi:RNA polymerase-binding transcription factor DksA